MTHDRSDVHEGHLFDIIADFTESPADRALESWIRNLSTADRTLPLAVALQDGLLHDRWPWTDKQPICNVCQSEWVEGWQIGPRLQMQFCQAALGHEGEHTYGEWSSR